MAETSDHVILLHGLARTAVSMLPMEQILKRAGYQVHNIGYPSRDGHVQELAAKTIPAALAECENGTIHFVTHSMGGIMLRWWLTQQKPNRLGNSVMLAPPNQGTELVDKLAEFPFFNAIQGEAALQLGTDKQSVPRDLPPADFPVGIIAGDVALNPVTNALIGKANDGKVAVESTKLEGMRDHLVLPVTHTFLMNNPLVIAQTLTFLRSGAFAHDMTWADAIRYLAQAKL